MRRINLLAALLALAPFAAQAGTLRLDTPLATNRETPSTSARAGRSRPRLSQE